MAHQCKQYRIVKSGERANDKGSKMPYRNFGGISLEVVEKRNYLGSQFILVRIADPSDFAALGEPENHDEVFAEVDGKLYKWYEESNSWGDFLPGNMPGPKGDKGDAGVNGTNGTNGTNGIDGKRIDTYSGTTDANGLFTVTYTTAFPSVPTIQPGPYASNNHVWQKVSSTTTGFSLRLVQRASVNLLSTDLLLSAVTNVSGASVKATVIAV